MTHPDYFYEATTVVVPIDEHPGQVHLRIGSDPVVVVLSVAQAVQLAGDLLVGVQTALDAEENPWT